MGNRCRHTLAPFKEQDKLGEGFLKTKDGNYVGIENYGTHIDNNYSSFSDMDEQDELENGLIKRDSEDYIPLDNIKDVEEHDCFIATTVYGDINAPQVQVLRDFRDDVLMENLPGRIFVDFYYSGAGKKAADVVRKNLPHVIPTIRKMLDTVVKIYST